MPIEYSPVEVLRDQWWVGILALGVSLTVTPVVRAIAYRARIVDRPDDLLKPHGRPIAYLGGVGMCLGLLVGLAGYVAAIPDAGLHWVRLKGDLAGLRIASLLDNPLWKALAIAGGSVLITAVGLLDDIKNISPRQKLCGQLAAALILLAGGVGHRMAMVVFSPLARGLIGLGIQPAGWVLAPPFWLLLPLSVAMCLLVVIATCNATNLLDGLDGLCGGVTGIISLGFLALAVWLAMWGRFPGTDELRVGLCLAMAGAVLGFLPYNLPPASIFMGDAGSMLLGFFVAAMLALFSQEGAARWFIAACAVFALPILDTALAVVRRLLAGVSIFTGDRSHLYDQLVDRGMSVREVVALFYILAFLTGALGVLLAIFLRLRYAMLIYAVLLVAVWTLFYKLGMVHPPEKKASNE